MSADGADGPRAETLAAGRRALAAGEWRSARQAFAAAAAEAESAEALEGLGWASWWLDDVEASFEARQRAYRLLLRRGDLLGAARVAIALGVDVWDFHGQAVANGWLQRARRHLENEETSPEHGWLALWEGHLGRLSGRDCAEVAELARRAREVALSCGVPDLELLALGLEGHALVAAGDVEAGMRQLDEATAAVLAGEITDLDAAQQVCCMLLHTCEQVRDYDRAVQWTERAGSFSLRWHIRPLHAICRCHYAGVLLGRGDWQAAESELEAVLAEVEKAPQPQARSEALIVLGELRRRQGRWEEAEELFRRVEGWSLSLVGRAAIALDAGRPSAAVPLLERALRRAAPDNWTVRARALALQVGARLETGDSEAAAEALERLAADTEKVGTLYMRAGLALARGRIAAAEGRVEEARQELEDSVDFFERAAAPYEAARSRRQLARVLAAEGDAAVARRTLAEAEAELTRLGGERLVERLGRSPAKDATAPGGDGPLTPRETEVLSLVADGLGDKEIAAELHLSEHTVHRHVSNILNKLTVPSRAAAVAEAVRAGLI